MNKNTILGFIAIGAIMFGFSWYQSSQMKDRAKAERMDTESFTNAAVLLFVALAIGTLVTIVFNNIQINVAGNVIKFTFPGYIGAMIVAAVIRNIADAKGMVLPASAIDTWGNSSLSIFLAIALMTLKLWQLADLAGPMIIMLAAQTLLMFFFARYVVFTVMGRDYEAAVMTSAFCGFGMGAGKAFSRIDEGQQMAAEHGAFLCKGCPSRRR